MSTKNWVTIILGAFLGGAGNWGAAHLGSGVPDGDQQVKAFALGSAIAGLVAVFHLFQTAPTDAPKLAKLASLGVKGLVLWMWLPFAAAACLPPQAVTSGIVAGVDFGVCVLKVVAEDVGKPDVVIAADAIKDCGGTAEQVSRVRAAHQRAMDAEHKAEMKRTEGTTSMDFFIVDQSTNATAGAPFGGPISQGTLGQIAEALHEQLNRDLATYWGGAYRVSVGVPSDAAPGAVVCSILDALPDAPGAVAFHDVYGQALPVVYVARAMCNGVTTGTVSISAALSHELCETAGDPACNLWADDGAGAEWARELCDAVEANSYEINNVLVSDFVLPAFFAPGAAGPLNFMAALNLGGAAPGAPLAVASGGYQIQRMAGMGRSQVTGAVAPHLAAKKSHWNSRTFRRGVRALAL